MKKINLILITCIYAVTNIVLITSCKKNDLDPTFKADAHLLLTVSAAQGAIADSVVFSYAIFPTTLTDTTVIVTAQILGNLSKEAREFKIAVDPSSTALASEYTIPSTLSIPANGYNLLFPVTIKRTARLTGTSAKLVLTVVGNTNFKPGPKVPGTPNLGPTFSIVWTDMLTKPSSWDSGLIYSVGKWSKVKHQLVIDLTGFRNYSGLTTAQQYGIGATLLDYVNAYNASHPGNPLKDENGNVVLIGSNL